MTSKHYRCRRVSATHVSDLELSLDGTTWTPIGDPDAVLDRRTLRLGQTDTLEIIHHTTARVSLDDPEHVVYRWPGGGDDEC